MTITFQLKQQCYKLAAEISSVVASDEADIDPVTPLAKNFQRKESFLWNILIYQTYDGFFETS